MTTFPPACGTEGPDALKVADRPRRSAVEDRAFLVFEIVTNIIRYADVKEHPIRSFARSAAN
jgi:hypothetical protein